MQAMTADYGAFRGHYADQDGGQETEPKLRLTLLADPRAVALARQATRDALAAWRLGHVEDTAVLLVSELVTNAVRHARDTDVIALELRRAGTRLRMEIQDGDPVWPQPRTPVDCDQSGFGFVLIDALAGRWGVRETAVGKAVWAELDAPRP